MEKVILNRVLAVLLCISVVFCSLSVPAFAAAGAAIDIIMDILIGVAEDAAADFVYDTVKGDFGYGEQEYYRMDGDNYAKFVDAAGSSPVPKSGKQVSTFSTYGHLIKLFSPDMGYDDWYVQPYVVSNGHTFVSTNYHHYYYNGDYLASEYYCYTDTYSSADKISENSNLGAYKFILLEGYGLPFRFCLYYCNSITDFNKWNGYPVLYSSGSYENTVCISGNGAFNKNNITDYGYYMSRSGFESAAVSPSSVPSGSSVLIPRNASSFSELTVMPDSEIDSVINGDSVPDNSDSSVNGVVKGDIIVSGEVDVNISVPDININVNGNSGTGSSYEMPDTGFFESYLDEALEESSGIRRFIADFFGTLPGQITTLICIALVFAILMRIIGR